MEWQSGTEGRTDRLAVGAGCLAGLVLGGLILGLYVVLQPGKAASGGTV